MKLSEETVYKFSCTKCDFKGTSDSFSAAIDEAEQHINVDVEGEGYPHYDHSIEITKITIVGNWR